ncbi:unnamed protein product [Sphagnum jensenii]|uniref:MICOS complex subunit MIC60 n=1 Tax=Sphagnum jensenii TaxID=128206 RepID=A0ABP0VDJ3_9BRYO
MLKLRNLRGKNLVIRVLSTSFKSTPSSLWSPIVRGAVIGGTIITVPTLVISILMAQDQKIDEKVADFVPLLAPHLRKIGESIPENTRSILHAKKDLKIEEQLKLQIDETKVAEEPTANDITVVLPPSTPALPSPIATPEPPQESPQLEYHPEWHESLPPPPPPTVPAPVIPSTETSSATTKSVEVLEPPPLSPSLSDPVSSHSSPLSTASTATPHNVVLPSVEAEAAIKRIQTEAHLTALETQTQQSIALRKEIEQILLSDLHLLSPDQLKVRITQLASELFERTKWEGIRLHQSLKQIESDLSSKYLELIKHQRSELELEMKTKLTEQSLALHQEYTAKINQLSDMYETKLSNATSELDAAHKQSLKEALDHQSLVLKEEFTIDLNNTVAQLKNDFIQQQLTLQQDLEKLHAQLKAFDSVVNSIDESTQKSTATHQESAALLAFEAALSTPSKSIKSEWDAVTQYAQNNPLLQAILRSIPKEIQDDVTPPSLQEIRYRYRIVRKEIRREALCPPNMKGFIGSAVGTVLALATPAPEGYLEGDGLEEVLARVNYYVEKGNLLAALREAKTIDGYPATLAQDWIKLVEHRLIVEQAVKVMKANNLLTHKSIAL